jgi:DNA-directed RNA polymerase subunit RPC12/RpoP
MADKISGVHAVVEELGQQLDALQKTMDKARDTLSEMRKDGINQVDAPSETECDDLDGWEVAGDSITEQMELKVAEEGVTAKGKDVEKTERAATMKHLISLAPKVKGCVHAAQMVILYGNQYGRGIKCTKCGLKVFEKNSKGDGETVLVVKMP